MTAYDDVVLDGELTPLASATISITDEGLLRGDGVFEVIRIYDGTPFALDEHMARMTRSAANLRLPLDITAIEADIGTLLAAAGPGDCAMRCLVTRGGRRIVMLEPLKELPATIRLATVTYAPTRILDDIKSLSYGGNMLAGRIAREQGADEALLITPHGRLLEGPTSSLFYVGSGGELHTPPLSDHVLDSITRRHVIAVSGATERSVSTDEIPTIQEAFLASTLREVHPVHGIDAHDLPAPGERTAQVAIAVAEHIRDAVRG
jgi:branched-chain amino acid aminotransferase